MYATVFKGDPLDPARGQRYRENILRPGGSQDDIESLKVNPPPVLYHIRRLRSWNVCTYRTSSTDHQTRKRLSRNSLVVATVKNKRTCERHDEAQKTTLRLFIFFFNRRTIVSTSMCRGQIKCNVISSQEQIQFVVVVCVLRDYSMGSSRICVGSSGNRQ